MSESTNGSYCGVGIVLNPAEDTSEVTVLHVYPDTPAAEAGIEEGDVIQSIDGVSVPNAFILEAFAKIFF